MTAPDRVPWLVVRWLVGIVGAASAINAAIGLARGRLTYSLRRSIGDDPVALTASRDVALGTLCFGVIAAVLLSAALAPGLCRRPAIIMAGAMALVAAMAGLSYLG